MKKTSISEILTTGTRLYSKDGVTPISREYTWIGDFKEYQNEQGETFLLAEVADQIITDNAATTLISYLGPNGKIVTNVYSSALDMIRELRCDENYDNFKEAEKLRIESKVAKKQQSIELKEQLISDYIKIK